MAVPASVDNYGRKYQVLEALIPQKVYWKNDATGSTDEPQYICRLSKVNLPDCNQVASPITKFPLVHAAHWVTEELKLGDNGRVICMSTNGEVYRGGV